MSFKVGDVVRLKSGGPRMCVEAVHEMSPNPLDKPVHCVWYDGESSFSRATFVADVLKIAPEIMAD